MDRFQAITAFVTVVETGSFARAAERLDQSVSAVSRHVAELEGHLDARLLNRTTRRLSLTEAGRTFHERCVQLLADLDEAEQSASGGGATPRGTLKVTCPITYGERVLAPIVAEFVAQAPGGPPRRRAVRSPGRPGRRGARPRGAHRRDPQPAPRRASRRVDRARLLRVADVPGAPWHAAHARRSRAARLPHLRVRALRDTSGDSSARTATKSRCASAARSIRTAGA